MIMKKERARWIPPLEAAQEAGTNYHGWIHFDGEQHWWAVTNIYLFADYGVMLETFTIEKGGETKEIYSYDEGETFTFDID